MPWVLNRHDVYAGYTTGTTLFRSAPLNTRLQARMHSHSHTHVCACALHSNARVGKCACMCIVVDFFEKVYVNVTNFAKCAIPLKKETLERKYMAGRVIRRCQFENVPH